MIHYHMGWRDPDMSLSNVNTGKQIRPLLLMLVCQASGGDWKQAALLRRRWNCCTISPSSTTTLKTPIPHAAARYALEDLGRCTGHHAGDAIFALAHIALIRLAESGLPAERVLRALRRFDETGVSLAREANMPISALSSRI